MVFMCAQLEDRKEIFEFLATIIMMNKEAIPYANSMEDEGVSPYEYKQEMVGSLSRKKGGLRTYLANPKNPASVKKTESSKAPPVPVEEIKTEDEDEDPRLLSNTRKPEKKARPMSAIPK